jgi:uncharacterized protein
MSIEVTPLGVTCNLSCGYCYEDPMRHAGNLGGRYDMAAMKAALERQGGAFTLFGGEPLLMPIGDLEELLRWGQEKFGHTSVQTNGSLITPRHLELFRRHCVTVSISVDGPGELNDSRWAGDLEKTRAATAASFRAIDDLLRLGRLSGLIVTLHRGNAVGDRLERLAGWFRELDAKGLKHARLHALEVDHQLVRDHMSLTEAEADAAFERLFVLQDELPSLRFDVFGDMAKLLVGDRGDASCIWNGCDPLTTPAVQAVNGSGGMSNCSRTNKDGIDWVKADTWGNERSRILYMTPQEDGGCKGCRFFFACQGQCPGTAIAGDWRNRSEQCALWFKAFERVEGALMALGKPVLSQRAAEREALERAIVERENGGNQDHGDHWDAPHGFQHDDAGFAVHGDGGVTTTHGDAPHGDHNDAPAGD